jgi:ubiquinone/menaquinone biosynthesis C-methylase UbiE
MDTNVLEYRQRILSKISEHVAITGRETVADIGCGDGGVCELLSVNVDKIVGIVVEPNFNWQKTKNAKIGFSVADVCNLPFPDKSFELVYEKDVLHHVEDKIKASREILRITKPGGFIICIEGNRYNPIFYFHMTLMKGHDHFTKSFFKQLMGTFSKRVEFFSVESRVYPMKKRSLLKMLHYFENLVEVIPLVRDFSCYNIAIIEKNKVAED